jgi:hypothetical protein
MSCANGIPSFLILISYFSFLISHFEISISHFSFRKNKFHRTVVTAHDVGVNLRVSDAVTQSG